MNFCTLWRLKFTKSSDSEPLELQKLPICAYLKAIKHPFRCMHPKWYILFSSLQCVKPKTVGAGIEVGSSWNFFAKTSKIQPFCLKNSLEIQFFSSLQLGSSWHSISENLSKNWNFFQESPQKGPITDLWYWHWSGVKLVLFCSNLKNSTISSKKKSRIAK